MKEKILTVIFYPIAFVTVWFTVIKSILKNSRFFIEHHPGMSKERRHERTVENVLNDLQKFKREHGIIDRPTK